MVIFYSPELNPDELLNQDVQTNALARVRPVNVQEMMDNVRSYLRITQARPKVVKTIFVNTTSDMPPVEKCHQFSARSNNNEKSDIFPVFRSPSVGMRIRLESESNAFSPAQEGANRPAILPTGVSLFPGL
jgi:hypothetical protein